MNRTLFRDFFHRNLPNDMEQCIELFAIFGGLDRDINTDQPLDTLISEHILKRYEIHYQSIHSPISDDSIYERLLHAVAIGDRRQDSAYRRAKIGKERGAEAFAHLRHSNYLVLERSREMPPMKTHPKQKFKKEVEHHKISHKFRFSTPFLRFWFAFVYPFNAQIRAGNYIPFLNHFHAQYNAFVGFTFEELCNLYIDEILTRRFDDVLIDSGSYWDREVEIDLLCETANGETWVGECKWTNHKLNKKELHKLEEKCHLTNVDPDKILLFAKRGFSNELLTLRNPHIYCFNAEALEVLTHRL